MYKLIYFNIIVELVLWMFVIFVKFFCEVDFYEFTSWVYESSLHISHKSIQTLESDNLGCSKIYYEEI